MCDADTTPMTASPTYEEEDFYADHRVDMWRSSRFKNFHLNPLFEPAVITLPGDLSGSICLFDGRSLREGHTLLLARGLQFPLVIPEDIIVRSVLALHASSTRGFVWVDDFCGLSTALSASVSAQTGNISFSSAVFDSFSVPHAAFAAQAAGRFRGHNRCTCEGLGSITLNPDLARKSASEVLGLLAREEL